MPSARRADRNGLKSPIAVSRVRTRNATGCRDYTGSTIHRRVGATAHVHRVAGHDNAGLPIVIAFPSAFGPSRDSPAVIAFVSRVAERFSFFHSRVST